MDTITKEKKSAIISAASLLLGIMADVFFYSHPIGLNVVLYVLVFLGAAGGLIFLFRERMLPGHALLIYRSCFSRGCLRWYRLRFSPCLTG